MSFVSFVTFVSCASKSASELCESVVSCTSEWVSFVSEEWALQVGFLSGLCEHHRFVK